MRRPSGRMANSVPQCVDQVFMWVLGTGGRVQPFAPRLSSSVVLYGVDQIDASWMDEQVFVVQKELDHVQAVQNRHLWTSCNMAVTEDRTISDMALVRSRSGLMRPGRTRPRALARLRIDRRPP